MESQSLPDGWTKPPLGRQSDLAAQVRAETDPDHPLARTEFQVIAACERSDDVIVEAPALSPRYYLLHLQWTKDARVMPLAGDDPAVLALDCEPDADDVDDVTLWTDSATETGAVFVQHLLSGREIVDVFEWPTGAKPRPDAVDTKKLAELGWVQVTGDLHPRAWRDGALVLTGQSVAYYVRPIKDDFFLFCVVDAPGEARRLTQLVPYVDRIMTFDSEAEFEAFLPSHYACRFNSPMSPGYGRSGFPSG
ncbi:hypothetical protein [uncultured Roseibium sp.]|uniref:hypothetical protein n=1 Tax=uncultured Roseibium sp. TaxID=1936171 RepID=UPI0032170D52